MKKNFSNYTYYYTNNRPRYHHAYLVSPLLEMLATLQEASQTKLRVLDLGCGNGSLSHVIAEQAAKLSALTLLHPELPSPVKVSPSVSLSKQIFTTSPIPICCTHLMLS
jgi:Cyclopropane fatty acid synthase and related methyltransferases